MTELDSFSFLQGFLHKIGFDFVLDFSIFIELVCEWEYQRLLTAHRLILTSECPGWICYLEKVLGNKIIPYASKIKTPQMLSAMFLRKQIQAEFGLSDDKIFICLVAPCYDKKLEMI